MSKNKKIDIDSAEIKQLRSAWVGNSNRYEGYNVPATTIVMNEVAKEFFRNAILNPFTKEAELFNFTGILEGNPTYEAVASIFDKNTIELHDAEAIAKTLYESCENPKVHGGELLIALVDGVFYEDAPCQAIALFKVNGHDQAGTVTRNPDQYVVGSIDVPSVAPDIAALIINFFDGAYTVMAIDKVSKKDERSFWKDDFLKLRFMEDAYFWTRHAMAAVAEFIPYAATDTIDKMDLMLRAKSFFKEEQEYSNDSIAAALFPDESLMRLQLIGNIVAYEEQYQVEIETHEINKNAVKKHQKLFKLGIKLDGNFKVEYSGRKDLIQRGFDEDTGRKYYKLYFDQES